MRPFNGRNILNMAAIVLTEAHTFAPDRPGGYFCLAELTTGAPLLLSLFGDLSFDRMRDCSGFAQEKPARLAAHPEHVSSFQSKDKGTNKFPGAIRARHFIFSFSGFPSSVDEAAMLVLAVESDELTFSKAREIASLMTLTNPHYLYNQTMLCSMHEHTTS